MVSLNFISQWWLGTLWPWGCWGQWRGRVCRVYPDAAHRIPTRSSPHPPHAAFRAPSSSTTYPTIFCTPSSSANHPTANSTTAYPTACSSPSTSLREMPLPEPRAAARASVQTPDMVAMARLQPPWPSGGGDNILTPLVIAVSRGQLRSWRADVDPHVRLRRVMCSVGFVSWPLPDPGNLHRLLQHHQHHQHPHLRHLVCQTQRLPHQPTQPSNCFSRSRRQELWPGGPGSAPVERASSTTPSHPRHANTATSASVRRERRCGGGCGGEADHRAAGPGRAHRAHWPGTSETYCGPRTAGPNECGREEESQRSRKAASRKRKEENETAEEREQRRLAKSVENEKQHKKRKQKAVVLACVLYVKKN